MMKNVKHIILAILASALLYACRPAGGEHPGSEYMPDMAHSIAYEANVYTNYWLNTWDSASLLLRKDLSNPRLPVKGTVPRGYAGVFLANDKDAVMAMLRGGGPLNSIAVPVNGHVPYPYDDTEEERERAAAEIIFNPYPITAEGLARGKELYDIFCGICHGEKGDGAGYIARDPDPAKGDPGGKYPVAAANLLLDDYLYSSNGRYYHAIIYGKNVMGGYADKMDYEERWQVIHYIRSLQAKEKKLEYSEKANTLYADFGIPAAQAGRLARESQQPAPSQDATQGEQNTDNGSLTQQGGSR
jgi:mono/diheme cytochrome c family protein